LEGYLKVWVTDYPIEIQGNRDYAVDIQRLNQVASIWGIGMGDRDCIVLVDMANAEDPVLAGAHKLDPGPSLQLRLMPHANPDRVEVDPGSLECVDPGDL
jgi:hypothetical protein